MKKLKQFLFIFVPLLLVIAIQFLATYFAMGLSLLIESGWYSVTGSAGFLDIVDDAFSLWSSQRFNTGVLLIYNAMAIAVFGLWYYCRYGGNYRPALRQTFHPAAIAGIVMLMPGTQYLTTYIMSFVAALFPHWMDAYESLLETAGLDDQISILMVVCSVIFAPFCEELVFRGVTMHQAKKCLPFWAVEWLSSSENVSGRSPHRNSSVRNQSIPESDYLSVPHPGQTPRWHRPTVPPLPTACPPHLLR